MEQAKNIAVLSDETVKKVCAKLIAIIAPDPEGKKLQEQGKWVYGSFGWFDKFPYAGETRTAQAPAIILTPQSIWKRTGVALAARRHSNTLTGVPRAHVYVRPPGFREGYLSLTDFKLINPYSRQSTNARQSYVRFGAPCMAEVVIKLRGIFSDSAYEDIKTKFPGQRGELPEKIYIGTLHRGLG